MTIELRNDRLKKDLLNALAFARLDAELADQLVTELAAKIGLAWLKHGIHGGPNTASVSKEVAQIEKLSRELHNALINRSPSMAARVAMATKAGGMRAFNELRRDAVVTLAKLQDASNQNVAIPGRKVDRYAVAVADACAVAYTKATGLPPRRTMTPDKENPDHQKRGGPFFRFVVRVFTIVRVNNPNGSAATQVERIVVKPTSKAKKR